MQKRFTSVWIFVFLFHQWAFGQSTVKIAGYVNSISGEPIEGANVVVQGTGFGAATDAAGHFTIENLFAGIYAVKASHLGYRDSTQTDVRVQKDGVTTLYFRLTPFTIPLDEVVVEARSSHGEVSEFRETISAETIQRSPARTVGELLTNLPGVEVIDEGGGSAQKRISIRGGNPNQVLVVLDGVVINSPQVGYADLSQIPLAWVEEIHVWKGGGSGRFGSGALGGVIEIISKRHSIDRTTVAGQFGNFGAIGIQPAISGRAKFLSYFFNFDYLQEDGDFPYRYQKLDGEEVREQRLNADFTSKNYFGKLIFERGDQAVDVQANVYDSNRGLPGLVHAWSPYARARTNRRIVMAQYRLVKNGWEARAQISQHVNANEFDNDLPPDAPLRFRAVPPFHSAFRVRSYRGALDSKLAVFRKQALYFNMALQWDDFKDQDRLDATAGPIRATENFSFGGSLRSDWFLPTPKFLSKIVVKPAMRLDKISFENNGVTRTDRQISPHVGLLISRSDGWHVTLKANWGRSFRVPTFADLFFQDFRVRGNPNLLPERSWNFDTGVQVGLPLLGRLEIESIYFHQRIENQIVWELGSFATLQPFNTDALLNGWEQVGSWKIFKNRVHLLLSHIFLNAINQSGQRTTHDKKLTYRPQHTVKFGLVLDFKSAVLSYQKRWVGSRFVTAANTVRLPGYTVNDLSLNLAGQIYKLKVNLKFSINNLFDEQYEILENAPLPGRHWRAGFELNY